MTAAKFDKETLNHHMYQLKQYHNKITAKIPLTTLEIESANQTIANYYSYLIAAGVIYGQIALDVIENQNAFGKFANHHLKETALAEGKKAFEIDALTANVRIGLAYEDADIRMQQSDNDGFLSYNKIANYHYKILEKQGLSKYAWGGTLFENFCGTGSWVDLGGYDTSIDVKQLELMKSAIGNLDVNGVNFVKAFESIMRTASKHPELVLYSLENRALVTIKEVIQPVRDIANEYDVFAKYANMETQSELEKAMQHQPDIHHAEASPHTAYVSSQKPEFYTGFQNHNSPIYINAPQEIVNQANTVLNDLLKMLAAQNAALQPQLQPSIETSEQSSLVEPLDLYV